MRSKLRIFYLALGWTAVALGVLGIGLPVLPTTPFMLLAAWCFAKSSKRSYEWLMYHPKIGRYLRDYKANRGIPMAVKLEVLALLWATMAVCIFVVVEHIHIKLLLFAITIAVTTHILTIKTRKRRKSNIVLLVPTPNELKGASFGANVIVEECGVGAVRTALKSVEAINKYDPEWIILCGWAGAYPDAGLAIGDCVSVESEREADLGTVRNGEFVDMEHCGFVAAEEYAPQRCPFHLQSGLRSVQSNTVNRCGIEANGSQIENMEGSGFFRACVNSGCNFLEIRVISNIVGELVKPEVAEKLGQTLSPIIEKLAKK